MKHVRYFPNSFFLRKHLFLLLYSFMLFSCCSPQQHSTKQSFNAINNSSPQFQTNITFPLSLKQCDESILPTNYCSFIAYKNQAYIYFSAKNIRSFDCYINNQKVPTTRIAKYHSFRFNASPYIHNGTNHLYIAQVKPQKKENTYSLQIQIPYPTIQQTKQKSHHPQVSFTLIDDLINAETEKGFPGAQLLVVRNGQLLKNSAYGVISRVDRNGNPLKNPVPVTPGTLFDIASNTKMYVTNFILQKLIAEEKIQLSDTISRFFPDFKDTPQASIKGKSQLTIFDLLTHQSGFPAGGCYFNKIPHIKNKETKTNRELTCDLIMKTPLRYPPRSRIVYSDINYMLLTFIIEKICNMRLDEYIFEQFFQPLNLNRICFKPLERGFAQNEIAATEYSIKRPNVLKHGTVHDNEACFSMDQVSGHAGLFSNAECLAVLAQIMLNGGGYGLQRFFPPHITAYFTAQQTLNASIGLGWRRQGPGAYRWAFSGLASQYTFGHTGWTGTVTVIDPEDNLIIILLTNAKNTPPLKKFRSGKFQGDYYLLKEYGAITSFVYEACKNADTKKLHSMLIELAEKRYQILQEIPAFKNKGMMNSLAAVMKTIRKRAFFSRKLRIFLKSDTTKAIDKLLATTSETS